MRDAQAEIADEAGDSARLFRKIQTPVVLLLVPLKAPLMALARASRADQGHGAK
jgi:hypothetical protein